MTEAAAAPSVKALTCTNCGGPVELRAAGYSVSLICPHCGSTLDASTPELKLIAKTAEVLGKLPIPLGTRGVLGGVEWEVVGYMSRADDSTQWREFLLFNPYYGYRFLVDDKRRFSLGVVLDRRPERGHGVSLDGQSYELFGGRYTARVTAVVGEFYWRVAVDDSVTELDFVRPGKMLSCERTDDEETWTQLKMLDRGVAEKAFGLRPRLHSAWPPSPHEPSPYSKTLLYGLLICLAAAALLLGFALLSPTRVDIGSVPLVAKLEGPERTITAGPIVLPGAHNRVVISVEAGSLDNSWVDMDISLVERRTQDSYDGYTLAEHYHGVDSDGAWSEGSPSGKVEFSGVPAGQYDLVMDVGAHKWVTFIPAGSATFEQVAELYSGPDPQLVFTASRGGLSWSNFWLALACIAAWPILLIYLEYSFHSRRRSVLA